MVEDEHASIKNSGDGETANHRDYGSNVNTALIGSPVSEVYDTTNDTLEGLHQNNGYQVCTEDGCNYSNSYVILPDVVGRGLGWLNVKRQHGVVGRVEPLNPVELFVLHL